MMQSGKKKKFLVVGLGPIGKILACHLKAGGNSVCGIDIRQDYIEALQKKGINIEGVASLHTNIDQVCTRPDELKEQAFDYVVVSVKTPYMDGVVSMLENFPDNYRVVSMQNGIDNEEYLAQFFDRERVMRFVINFAGNIISPGHVKMTFFHKPNFVGCLCGTGECAHARDFADLLTAAGLDTDATDDIKKLAWRKTILVAALAPISALLDMTMLEVMNMDETKYLVEMLLEEAIEVARGRDFDYGDDFFAYCIDYLTKAGHHKPSMLIDIEGGNPTEIDYINAKISHHGHKLDIPVHLNTYLTLLVKAKEKLAIQRKENNPG